MQISRIIFLFVFLFLFFNSHSQTTEIEVDMLYCTGRCMDAIQMYQTLIKNEKK
jgi:hypothetical protein